MGSATPAIESYYNATRKVWFVELLKRYSDIKLPKIEPVDLKKGFLKTNNGFFQKLIDQISIQLKETSYFIKIKEGTLRF